MTERIAILKTEMQSELCSNILPFWLDKMVDNDHGGFNGHLDFHGRRSPGANKGAILNARILWTFSSSYRILKKDEYRIAADRAYAYIIQHFIDKEYGGVYWELDHKGDPVNKKKQIYALAFTIYGLTEYYRISAHEAALELAISLYHDIEKYSLDRVNNGYFEAFTRIWQPIEDLRLSAKDQNESKTMNTHLHILEGYTNLYRVWKDPGLKNAIKNLVQLFLDKFISEDFHLNLFFDDDWILRSDLVSYGHDIESAWLIYEAAEIIQDKELLDITESLSIGIATNNFQGLADDGGLIYEFFPSENRKDKDKHWWPQAEAVVGYFHAYQLSGDKHFLDAAIRSWSFIKDHIIDKTNGEWHWSVNHDGEPQEGEEKAGFWKCPYHNSRACLEIIVRAGEGEGSVDG